MSTTDSLFDRNKSEFDEFEEPRARARYTQARGWILDELAEAPGGSMTRRELGEATDLSENTLGGWLGVYDKEKRPNTFGRLQEDVFVHGKGLDDQIQLRATQPSEQPEKDRIEFMHSVQRQLEIMEGSENGADLRTGIAPSPWRVTRMWLDEMTRGYSVDIESLFKLFPDEGYGGMVIVKDIPLISTCEHHLLPITGFAHIGYFPDKQVIGLSKLPRIVDAFARRLQLQERITQQILDAIGEHLKPKGTIVLIAAEHLCTTVRGIQAPGTKTVTCAVTGRFRDKSEQSKEEFMRLVGAQ